MDIFTETQRNEAKQFCDFFVDFIEHFGDRTKHYLSDDVILDYFGQTVKGQKNVANFIKSSILTVRHLFYNPIPVEKIGFRNTHVVKLPKQAKKFVPCTFTSPTLNEAVTPVKPPQAAASGSLERGQGDGFHNCEIASSPKKPRLGDGDFICENESDDTITSDVDVKYIYAEGAVEFHRKSMKKLQGETKWQRPCKLSVAYSWSKPEDCQIYLIIYEGNVKCRRNLMKDFSAAESEN